MYTKQPFLSMLSILALAISVYEGTETRKHNRLSVTPGLVFHETTAQQREHVGLFVENGGLGPVIIKEMRISIGGKDVKDWAEVTKILTEKETDDPFRERNPRRVYLTPGYVIPLEEKELLYTTKPEFVSNWKGFERIFSERLRVTISHCSFYEICQSVNFN